MLKRGGRRGSADKGGNARLQMVAEGVQDARHWQGAIPQHKCSTSTAVLHLEYHTAFSLLALTSNWPTKIAQQVKWGGWRAQWGKTG